MIPLDTCKCTLCVSTKLIVPERLESALRLLHRNSEVENDWLQWLQDLIYLICIIFSYIKIVRLSLYWNITCTSWFLNFGWCMLVFIPSIEMINDFVLRFNIIISFVYLLGVLLFQWWVGLAITRIQYMSSWLEFCIVTKLIWYLIIK